MNGTSVVAELVESLPFALCVRDDDDKNIVFAMFDSKSLAKEFFDQSVRRRLRKGQSRRWFILNAVDQTTYPV